MDGFDKRTEKKRDAIRKATLDLYQKYGIRKVSIADIAKQAHVSPATIYNHFSTKENLTTDSIKSFISDSIDEFMAIIDSDTPYPEIISNIIMAKTKRIKGLSPELLTEILATNNEVQKFYTEAYNNKLIPRWIDFLERGIKEGYVKKHFSNKALMVYVDILQKGIEACQDYFTDGSYGENINKELNEMFFYGLFNQ